MLAFGIGTKASAELVWPTTRVDNYDEEDNDATMLLVHDEREEIRHYKKTNFQRGI